jgi:hypothetical protein
MGCRHTIGEVRERRGEGGSTVVGRCGRPATARRRRARHGNATWPVQTWEGEGGGPVGLGGTVSVGAGQTIFKPFANSLN